jgi:transposase-like protein
MQNLDNKSSLKKIVTSSIINLRNSADGFSLDEFLLHTIETLMQIEREEYLAAAKSSNIKDKSNGFYKRNYKSLLQNHLRINIPRTRDGNFSPSTIELVKASNNQVQELVLSLYKKGMTSRDISDLLSEFFCEKMSKTSINDLAKSFYEIRNCWNNSKLEEEYLTVFCDALYITVRRGDSYAKEAVFIAYGVRKDYKRELLILESSPVESTSIWEEYFSNLKQRGVKKISLIVADGLAGFENQVMMNFPDAKLQKCVVHKMRNVTKHVSPKDKKDMYQDLKHVFDNFDKESSQDQAYIKADKFIQKWQRRYPKIGNYFKKEDFDYYLTYIKYDYRIRRMIYTTNAIESLNSKLKKATRNKLSFEKPQYLLDYLFIVIKEYQDNNWMVFPVAKFKYFCEL